MKENQGNLSETGLPRLLHLIYKRRDPAGVLDIVREPIKKRLYFRGGVPVFASSNILGEVLGRLLMNEGIITQKEYETSLETVLSENRRHGEVLISMGLITPEELSNFLSLQMKRRVWKIFGWTDGVWRYASLGALPEAVTPNEMHPARLILDGVSLGFYPLERINLELKEYIGEPVTFALDKAYTLEDFGLKIQEQRFFDAIDGRRTLKEVLDSSDLLRQRALSLALSFITTGMIRKTGEAPEEEELLASSDEGLPAEAAAPAAPHAPGAAQESKVNAELLFMKAKSSIARGDFFGASATLKKITELNPMEAEYWAHLGWAAFNAEPTKAAEAERIIKDSIDLNNELDTAWFFLGKIFLAKGEEILAESAFRTSYEKNPWMLDAVAELKRIEIKRMVREREAVKGSRPYVERLGVELDPFTEAPYQGFKIKTVAEEDALEFLLRGLKKKAGPLLIEGLRGSGKTTAILELLTRLSNTKTLCAVILDPPARELDLIRAINTELNSTTASTSIKEQLLSLGMRVSQNKIQSGHTVIVIDRAERLTDGCLKLVQYLARLKSVQLVLVADELQQRLKTSGFEELDSKVLARSTTGPLTREETAAYLTKRLKTAGASGFAFTESEIDVIFEKSSGVPGEINRCAAETLSEASSRHHRTQVGEEPDFDFTPLEVEGTEPAPAPLTSAPIELGDDSFEMPGGVNEEESPGTAKVGTAKDSSRVLRLVEPARKEEPGPAAAGDEDEFAFEPAPGEKAHPAAAAAGESPPDADFSFEPAAASAGPPQEASGATDRVMDFLEDVPPARATTPDSAGAAAEAAAEAERPAHKERKKPVKKKGGALRLIVWVIVMLVLGLAAGSAIGIYLLGR